MLRYGDNGDQVLASEELTVMSALVGSVVLSTAASQLLTVRKARPVRASGVACIFIRSLVRLTEDEEKRRGQPTQTVEIFASMGWEKLPTGRSKVEF